MPRKLHPCQCIRVADDLWSGDMRKLHPCQGIRFADSLRSGDMRKVPRSAAAGDGGADRRCRQPASLRPPRGHEHRVDGGGDADRGDEDRGDGHRPARDAKGKENGADREERRGVGDLPGHNGLRSFRQRGESLHARSNRMDDGYERIYPDGEARRPDDARRNVLVGAEVPAADERGREHERNDAKEKPRDDAATAYTSRRLSPAYSGGNLIATVCMRSAANATGFATPMVT